MPNKLFHRVGIQWRESTDDCTGDATGDRARCISPTVWGNGPNAHPAPADPGFVAAADGAPNRATLNPGASVA